MASYKAALLPLLASMNEDRTIPKEKEVFGFILTQLKYIVFNQAGKVSHKRERWKGMGGTSGEWLI